MKQFPYSSIGKVQGNVSDADASEAADKLYFSGFFVDDVRNVVDEYETHLAKVNAKRKKGRAPPPPDARLAATFVRQTTSIPTSLDSLLSQHTTSSSSSSLSKTASATILQELAVDRLFTLPGVADDLASQQERLPSTTSTSTSTTTRLVACGVHSTIVVEQQEQQQLLLLRQRQRQQLLQSQRVRTPKKQPPNRQMQKETSLTSGATEFMLMFGAHSLPDESYGGLLERMHGSGGGGGGGGDDGGGDGGGAGGDDDGDDEDARVSPLFRSRRACIRLPFDANQIRKVVFGAHHGALIANDDDIYTWGIDCSPVSSKLDVVDVVKAAIVGSHNQHRPTGQLGRGDNSKPEVARVNRSMFHGNKGCSDLACGTAHTVAVVGGSIFTWGSNDAGQLGIENEDDDDDNDNVGDGGESAKDERGEKREVTVKQQRKPPPISSRVPQELSSVHATFVHVACGSHHTLAVTSNGDVYAWGSNDQRQVTPSAAASADAVVRSPQRLAPLAHVYATDVAAGNVHSVALSRVTGCVYTWGSNLYGQLGHELHATSSRSSSSSSAAASYLVNSLRKSCFAVSIACGPFTTAAIGDMGETYLWGRLCAPGMLNHQFTPRLFGGQKLRQQFVRRLSFGGTHLALSIDTKMSKTLKKYKQTLVYLHRRPRGGKNRLFATVGNVSSAFDGDSNGDGDEYKSFHYRCILVPSTWVETLRVVRLVLGLAATDSIALIGFGGHITSHQQLLNYDGPCAVVKVGSIVDNGNVGFLRTSLLDACDSSAALVVGIDKDKFIVSTKKNRRSRLNKKNLVISSNEKKNNGGGDVLPSSTTASATTISTATTTTAAATAAAAAANSAKDVGDENGSLNSINSDTLLELVPSSNSPLESLLKFSDLRAEESSSSLLMSLTSLGGSRRTIYDARFQSTYGVDDDVVERRKKLLFLCQDSGRLTALLEARAEHMRMADVGDDEAEVESLLTTFSGNTGETYTKDKGEKKSKKKVKKKKKKQQKNEEIEEVDDEDMMGEKEKKKMQKKKVKVKVKLGNKKKQKQKKNKKKVNDKTKLMEEKKGKDDDDDDDDENDDSFASATKSKSEEDKVMMKSLEGAKCVEGINKEVNEEEEEDDDSFASATKSKSEDAQEEEVDYNNNSTKNDDDDDDDDDSFASATKSKSDDDAQAEGHDDRNNNNDDNDDDSFGSATKSASPQASLNLQNNVKSEMGALVVEEEVEQILTTGYEQIIEADDEEAAAAAAAAAVLTTAAAKRSATEASTGGGSSDEASTMVLDWNERFQSILRKIQCADGPNEYRDRYAELSSLVTDFIYLAETYAKIIIAEVYMPLERKTIKPVHFGGVAGGDKYVVHGILFKFSHNVSGLYGDDDSAAKVAGHDLKGLRAYFNTQTPRLHFPLMALVDYSGFRMSCQSLLPLDADTLMYGSADGALNVQAHRPLCKLLAHAANKLNVKAHRAGRRPPMTPKLYSAVDLEGHLGHDGRFYLVDFSRAFPPERPTPGVRSAQLFRLLRPEFVANYARPLCPDAYSGFVPREDLNEHNQEVAAATQYLRERVVPRVAQELQAMRMTTANNKTTTFALQAELHRRGVNLRLLGLIRSHAREPWLRTALLIEMIARVVRIELRSRMRDTLKRRKLPLEDPRRKAVLAHLNVVFGQSDTSDVYWKTSLKKALMSKFEPVALSFDERDDEYNLRRSFTIDIGEGGDDEGDDDDNNDDGDNGDGDDDGADYKAKNNEGFDLGRVGSQRQQKQHQQQQQQEKQEKYGDMVDDGGEDWQPRIFQRLIAITGLRFNAAVARNFCSSASAFRSIRGSEPFEDTDMEELGCRVKHLNIVERALGYVLKSKARKLNGAARQRLLDMSRGYFEQALEADLNINTLVNYADVLAMQGHAELADQVFLRALADASPDGVDAKTYFKYADYLEKNQRYAEAEHYYLASIEADNLNDHACQAYAYFLEEQRGDNATSESFFQLASLLRHSKAKSPTGLLPLAELFD